MDIKRESIFVSAVRTLCNTFGGMIGIIIGLFVIGIVIAVLSKPQMVTDKTQLIIAADAEGNREFLSHSAPVVLRLNIHGVIGTRDLNAKTIEAQLLDSRIGALKDDRVKAILLHINSPGGTAFDAHDIYSRLIEYKTQYKVPIYAYVDGMCASGGMMIACAADKISSAPIGIIGSVGVLMGPNFNVSGLMEKYGVKQLTITKGKDKDMLSPYREWKPGEDQSLRDIIDYDYNLFVDLVAKARPAMNKNSLINEYGAQVYDPVRAEQYGYIDDGKSSYSHALTELLKAADITEEYQVIELKVLHPVLSDLIEGKSPIFTGKIKHELQLPSDIPLEFMNRPLYLYSPALQWE
ncbi:MAG: S49 family peptidase [Simkaniaceae bacterium]|jgi:protease-4|nr:MAG: S49 family peptidase [Simkaniaceae bacterium]